MMKQMRKTESLITPGQLGVVSNPVADKDTSGETTAPTSPPSDVRNKRRRHFRRSVSRAYWWSQKLLNNSWLAETVSILIAWLAFVAIVISLLIHRDKPRSQELQLLSINTLIAIFTAVMKAALIMPVAEGIGQCKWEWFRKERMLTDLDRLDAASRGPWGSFLLLTTTHKNFLACFGALITIAALAIDPFSQQVINQYDCYPNVDNGVATITTTNRYKKVGTYLYSEGYSLDRQMANAIYTGLIDPPRNASASVAFTCSTGNCTFAEDAGATHMSLAMCGSCVDITESIIMNVTQAADNLRIVTYSLPLTFDYANISVTGTNQTRQPSEWLKATSSFRIHPDAPVGMLSAVMLRNCMPCGVNSLQSCECQPFGVGCSLFPCVKTYRAHIENNTLYESEISSVKLQSIAPTNDYVCLPKVLRSGKWFSCTNSSEMDADHPTRVDYLYNNTYKEVYTQGDCVWGMSSPSKRTILYYIIQNIWNGGLGASNTVNNPSAANGNPWFEALFNNGSATIETANAYIKGVADTITGVIRQNGERSDTNPVVGKAQRAQLCVRVQWAWLSLPAILLLLAIFFLLVMIWKTQHNKVVLWKSSPLALLFHGFDDEAREQYGPLHNVQDMTEAADVVHTRLEARDGRWRLTAR